MNGVIRLILVLLFDSTTWFLIVCRILYIIGACALLRKSGVKWYLGLIPWYREYQLARCAFREPEGRLYFVLNCSFTVVYMFAVVFDMLDDVYLSLNLYSYLLLIFVATLVLSIWIFNIRIYSGFTEIYGISKWWVVLCVFNTTAFIPMLIWGFSKKYQPKWKVEDIKIEIAKLSEMGSASNMEKGLSINIAARTVNDFFKKKYLLRDISLDIPSGHMVLLLGGSGAGKTTFINAVNGFEKANAKILLDGHDMYKEYNQMKHNVGFVPQPQMMRDKDTVKKTLMDAAEIRLSKDMPGNDKLNRVNEVMDIFGLLPVKDSLVEKLSGGQKKRLSISIELLSNPSLFILDEPDSGLDGVMARELFEILRDISDNNKIVIVITHSPDRVVDCFDDVIVLAKDDNRTGRLAFYGSIDEAREFFGKDSMEEIVKSVNRIEEGGEGKAEEYILKYQGMIQNG